LILCALHAQVCGLSWSPGGRQLASGGNDNKLLIWEPHGATPVHRYSDHVAAVKAIAWSPYQHGLLASGGGSADCCIRFWSTATGATLSHHNTGAGLQNQPACMQSL
jgi:cell division cycle 20-like protein 1 (cofactor of APC complex)